MKHRLFVAIDVPSTEIVALQSKLDQLRLPVIWEKPEKIHLTLNFLGRVTPDQLHPVSRAVSQVVKTYNHLTIELLFLETLYQRHDQTLIYLSAFSPDLIPLQKSLSQALNDISPQPRRFLPHITIGKIKRTDPATTKRVIDVISNFDYQPLSPFVADHLTLYESFLSAKGSTYQKIGQFMIKSPLP